MYKAEYIINLEYAANIDICTLPILFEIHTYLPQISASTKFRFK